MIFKERTKQVRHKGTTSLVFFIYRVKTRRPISYVVKITIHGKTTSYKFNNTNK